MRCLVAGAAGFLGHALALNLVRDGYDVIGVDNLLTGQERHVADLRGLARCEFRLADVTVPLPDVGHVDWVLHLASPAAPTQYQTLPLETLAANAAGTWRLLDLARSTSASFLFASTSEIYGDLRLASMSESTPGLGNPVGPRSAYVEGKRFGEALTRAYGRRRAVSTRIVRIFNAYGPGMAPNDGRVVPEFVTRALRNEPVVIHGDGEQVRCFTFVDDIVDGIRSVMKNTDPSPINLGNPDGRISVADLARLVVRLAGSTAAVVHVPGREDDPRVRIPDTSRARATGWRPAVPLEDGLERTIAHFRELMT